MCLGLAFDMFAVGVFVLKYCFGCIQNLETEIKQKDQAVKQLTLALRKLHRILQVMSS